MRLLPSAVLLVVTLAAPALRADVTIRYRNVFKLGSLAPMPNGILPESTVTRMKGAKVHSSFGHFTTLMDFARQEITVIDVEDNKFVTVPIEEYARKLSGPMGIMPEQLRKTMESMKTNSSRKTGRTELIQGVATEETEVTVTTDMPMFGESAKPGPSMKMVMHIWTSKPEEALRLPAVRELTAYRTLGHNLTSAFESFGNWPGIGSMMDDLFKNKSLMLKTQMAMYMPMMPSAGSGANVPLIEQTTEAVELSTAPIEDSVFQLPSGCRPTSFEDLMQSLTTRAIRKAAQPPTPSTLSSTDVQAFVPGLTPQKRVKPVWPESTRRQGVPGTVSLLVTVAPEGSVTNVEALTGPQELRIPAVDAVRQYQFRPVIRNGRPVAALTTQMVVFNGVGASIIFDVSGEMAAADRMLELESRWPRSPEQVLADLEQDRSAATGTERFYSLPKLAKAAINAGALGKAAAYAAELLKQAEQHERGNCGDAIHDGNMVLGIVALRSGDIEQAKQHLLAAARTPGSPQLGSFGPNQMLAKELLEKGERDVVLEYFSRCRDFWKSGSAQLEAWTTAVRNGHAPDFGANLLY